MRYLASVSQKSFLGKQTLQLHCKEVGKLTWIAIRDEITLDSKWKLQPASLVIAHITVAHQQLQKVELATPTVISALKGLSILGKRYQNLVHDIELWKDSMQLQLQELQRREEELMARAELLKLELSCELGSPHPEVPESLHDCNQADLDQLVKHLLN